MFLSTLNQKQKETFICLAHNVVVSDGDLSTGEQVMMLDMYSEMRLDPAFEPRYINLQGIDVIFDTHKSRVIALMALVQLGYADGAFEIEEQCFLSDLADAFKISAAEMLRIENWVRRLLALQQEALDLI